MEDHVRQYLAEIGALAAWHPEDDWRGLKTFNQHAIEMGWPHPTRELQFERLVEAQKLIVAEQFNSIEGSEQRRTLLRQVGIEVPAGIEITLTLCRSHLDTVFNCLVDLVQVRRHGGGPVVNHGTKANLFEYNRSRNKVCPVPEQKSKILRSLLK
jgi:hypothetical protein